MLLNQPCIFSLAILNLSQYTKSLKKVFSSFAQKTPIAQTLHPLKTTSPLN